MLLLFGTKISAAFMILFEFRSTFDFYVAFTLDVMLLMQGVPNFASGGVISTIGLRCVDMMASWMKIT